jgi:hypothetical protein
MFAMELQQLKDNASEVKTRVPELRKRMIELSNNNDVQILSHELHSSKLEYLGIVKGRQRLVQRVWRAAKYEDQLHKS